MPQHRLGHATSISESLNETMVGKPSSLLRGPTGRTQRLVGNLEPPDSTWSAHMCAAWAQPPTSRQVRRVDGIPAQLAAQAGEAEEAGSRIGSRLEHLAVGGFDPRRAGLEDPALAVTRERFSRRGSLDLDLDTVVGEAVARRPRAQQEAPAANPRRDPAGGAPAIGAAVRLEDLLEASLRGHEPPVGGLAAVVDLELCAVLGAEVQLPGP